MTRRTPLRALEDFRKEIKLHKDMKEDARKGRESVNDFKTLDWRLTNLTKALKPALVALKAHNEDPRLEEYGIDPLDERMSVADLLAEVSRRRGKDAETVERRMQLAPTKASSLAALRKIEEHQMEFHAMDALVKQGRSLNQAARLVARGRSVSPLLKRYRRARKSVAK
jgi:hypothetical protein